MTSIFRPTKKTIQSYADDLRNAYDLITGVMIDAQNRQREGKTDDEYYGDFTLKDLPPQEPWQSDLADLLGSLRVCEQNISHQLSNDSSAVARLLRRVS